MERHTSGVAPSQESVAPFRVETGLVGKWVGSKVPFRRSAHNFTVHGELPFFLLCFPMGAIYRSVGRLALLFF